MRAQMPARESEFFWLSKTGAGEKAGLPGKPARAVKTAFPAFLACISRAGRRSIKGMKRLSLFAAAVSACLLTFPHFAQCATWANVERYAQANAAVKSAPAAVFMGDSITDGWYGNDREFFEKNGFAGRGISGQVTSQMLVRFRPDVIDLKPARVFILAGTNDIAENNGPVSLETVAGNIESMCELARLKGIKPVICSVLPAAEYKWRKSITDVPRKIEKLNSMLKSIAEKNGYGYLDYHSALRDERGGLSEENSGDGVHPTKACFKIMEAMVLDYLGKN